MSSTIQSPRPKVSGIAPQPQQARSSILTRKMKTLRGQFILQASLILLLAGITTLVASTSLNRASNDLNTINSGSIPSVNYAQNIAQLVSDIDAKAAGFLATAAMTNEQACTVAGSDNTTTTNTATLHDCDERNIDAEIVLVNEQLFNAAHNTTYHGEQTAVERISTGLASYLGEIHLMRAEYALAKSKTDPNDPDLQRAYQAYLAAGKILHEQVSLPTINANQIPLDAEGNQLPTCTDSNGQQLSPDQWTKGSLIQALDCLSDINHRALYNAYDDASGFLGGNYWLLIFLGLLVGALLVYSTGNMAARTHRLINPGLLPAALIAIILSFNTIGLVGNLGKQSNMAVQDGAFKQLVKDDYDSVYYARLLQRDATDANADESRWLIALEFNDKDNIDRWQSDWNNKVNHVTSLIKKANQNQTWAEEITPLKNIQTFWSQYFAIDDQIRTTALDQGRPQHLFIAEGLSAGPSNSAFSDFSYSVNQLSAANSLHYNGTFDNTNSSLMLYFALSLVLFPLVGLLGVWGIWLRLKDF